MKLREATDGSLLVAGTRCRDTWPRAWFARLDRKANLLWQVTQDQGLPPGQGRIVTDSYGWDLLEWEDGHLLGLGFGSSGEGSLWMLEIAMDGRVLRSRTAFNALQVDEFWWGISVGGRSAEGARIGFTTGSNLQDVRIGWLDRHFQFRDEASLSGPGREETRMLDASPDGGFCALLQVEAEGLFIQRHAADGAQIWRRPVDNWLGSRLLALRDGGCLVSGGPEAEWGKGKTLHLRKFAANGDAVWNQDIAGAFSPRALVETPAGGLFIVGNEIPPNRQGSVPYVLYLVPEDLGKANVKPARR